MSQPGSRLCENSQSPANMAGYGFYVVSQGHPQQFFPAQVGFFHNREIFRDEFAVDCDQRQYCKRPLYGAFCIIRGVEGLKRTHGSTGGVAAQDGVRRAVAAKQKIAQPRSSLSLSLFSIVHRRAAILVMKCMGKMTAAGEAHLAGDVIHG